jgi:hypothetical protein
MALRIRFAHPTGAKLAYSVERLGDGLLFDFADGTFKAAPKTPTAALPEDVAIFRGRYKATLDPTPTAQFPDGDYTVTVHDQPEMAGDVASVVAELAARMFQGDDQPPSPEAFGAAAVAALARTLAGPAVPKATT